MRNEVTVVNIPDTSSLNSHYYGNRAPLKANPLIKLPVGSIRPAGWLKAMLERQRDGLTGNLNTISAWLQKEDNAWLSKDGIGRWGWEELPYWLRGYGNIGYTLNDKKIIEETRVWIEGALASQRKNGDFGPEFRFGDDKTRDYWANMVMLYCLQSYYEYSQDDRVIELMTNYFKHQLTVPDHEFLTHYWQHMRGGDNMNSVLWLYNRTGDKFLLELAHKIHRNTADWSKANKLPNWHNVNIAQGFREPATYYSLSHNKKHLEATYANFKHVRQRHGQVPGGMYGADEIAREGYDDPRQATETCGIVEQMFSDELLLGLTGDVFWADHCENVALNSFVAALMPDMRSLRYFTAPNLVRSDKENHAPGLSKRGTFLLMNPFSSRCCQHNHSSGWPYYTERLWMATPDNGLAATLYSASEVTATVGEGTQVTLTEETNYPYEEQVQVRVNTPEEVCFPLYLRIPGWCGQATAKINGETVIANPAPGNYIRIYRSWKNDDTVTLSLPMEVKVKTWTANHNSASVNYGPLTYSLDIKERFVRLQSTQTAVKDSRWQEGVDAKRWPSWEIHPESAWNYGLSLDPESPEESFLVEKKPWPEDNFPFTHESNPIVIKTKGKRIPEWKIDQYGLVGQLMDSPVSPDTETEEISLIPMGTARLRISAFPVVDAETPTEQKTTKKKNLAEL
ncbi:hypothetical protein FUAX_52350 (plasmid) [Fulvitalea axinellae]|uniref:DUF1680 family protein n=1 Tax=Fulvitalea axinellae TaxID=1182444 RepID=A0AAU9DA68_9BACT|nr:hypothetical protein FUAX_52350 [Fulvitalea axinellae]